MNLIEKYLAYMRRNNCTDKSVRVYKRTLLAADRELHYGLDRSNAEELEAWLFDERLSRSSSATYRTHLGGFFRWAEQHQLLDYNPMAHIPRPRIPRGVPRVARDEHVRVLTTQSPQPYRLWALLAAYAGMRCIEVYRAQREDVTATRIRINQGKGDKPRLVPTHPLIWVAVKDLPPGPLAHVRDEADISSRFKIYCKGQLGWCDVSMHRLRGWFCSSGYRRSRNIRAMQHGMGHANPGTTAGYIDVPEDELSEIIAELPVFEADEDDAA